MMIGSKRKAFTQQSEKKKKKEKQGLQNGDPNGIIGTDISAKFSEPLNF